MEYGHVIPNAMLGAGPCADDSPATLVRVLAAADGCFAAPIGCTASAGARRRASRQSRAAHAVRRASLVIMAQQAARSHEERPSDDERDPRLEREGLDQWIALGQDDTAALCDPGAGVPLRWVEGFGWVTE